MAIMQLPNHQVRQALVNHYNQRVGASEQCEAIPDMAFDGVHSLPENGVLYDLTRSHSLLFKKIDIATLLDFTVDITPFKTRCGNITSRDWVDFTGHPIQDDRLSLFTLTRNDPSLPNYTYDAMKKFVTFIRVVGLAELQLEDVHLLELPQKLIIRLSPLHPIYTGKIEVKTW